MTADEEKNIIEQEDESPEEKQDEQKIEEVKDSSPAEKDKIQEEVEIIEENDDEDEEGYKVKIKPQLDVQTKKSLSLREEINDRRPAFKRQEWFRYKKIGEEWRKPRGIQSKARRNYKYRPNKVSPGYRSPKDVRGLHPSGFKEELVYNVKDLENIDPKTMAARIGHSVGTRKRIDIEERAKELKIRVLNPIGRRD